MRDALAVRNDCHKEASEGCRVIEADRAQVAEEARREIREAIEEPAPDWFSIEFAALANRTQDCHTAMNNAWREVSKRMVMKL